jgi:hypothetical protein
MNNRRVWITLLAIVVVAVAAGGYLLRGTTAQDRPHDPATEGEQPAAEVTSAPAPQAAPSQNVALNESFDTFPASWKQFDLAAMPDQKGEWAAEAGKLAARAPSSGTQSFEESMLLAPADTSGRAELSVQVYPQGNQVVGLVFRSTDKGYYLFRVFREGESAGVKRMLQRYDAATGQYTTLAEDSQGQGYELGRWQNMSVELDGDHIVAFFEGQKVFDVRDGELAGGEAGVYALALGEVLFDNFTVLKP